ncbi:MAG: hypothetical protein ACK5JT_06780 [Hyphomicrobiaceae bacterium]
MGLIYFLRDIFLATLDALLARQRRRYEHSVFIRAPRDIVWNMIRARDIEFEGLVPLRLHAAGVPGRPDCELVHVTAGDIELAMLTRTVDLKDEQAILYEILPEGTDPALVEGIDDYISFVLADTAGGTRLDLMRELSPLRWIARLSVPIGLRSGAKRYKRKAETIARDMGWLQASKG